MFCEKCGSEISNNAVFCPNCGSMVGNTEQTVGVEPINTVQANPVYQAQPGINEKKGNTSGLGIAALVLSIMGCTNIIGLILAIVDIVKSRKDGRTPIISYIALGICGVYLVISILFVATFSGNRSSKQTTRHDSGSVTEQIDEYETSDSKSDKKSSKTNKDISPEFKKQVDAIEKFYNDYCDFMEKYASAAASGDIASMMNDYTRMMSDYATYESELNQMNNSKDEMTQAEWEYFLDAYNRIMKRLASVAYGM